MPEQLNINSSSEQPANALGLIKISGEDSTTFLQGQLTNDIVLLDGNWQFSGYCNPKGRLIALLKIWQHEQGYYALLSADLVDIVTKRLRMYVMRSKVTIEHIELASIIGTFSTEGVAFINQELADHIDSKIVKDDSTNRVFNFAGSMTLRINNHYLLVSEQAREAELGHEWQKLMIVNGLPQVSATSSEMFVPQMLNLDLLDGINFKKGCYTGQEIVARMHYLGKLKQRMFVFNLHNDGASTILAGDKVYTHTSAEGGSTDKRSIGNIVTASTEHQLALAVIRIEYQDQPLCLEDGSKLSIRENQPYDLG